MPNSITFYDNIDAKWLRISRNILNQEIPVTDGLVSALMADKTKFSNIMIFLAIQQGIETVKAQKLFPQSQQSVMPK